MPKAKKTTKKQLPLKTSVIETVEGQTPNISYQPRKKLPILPIVILLVAIGVAILMFNKGLLVAATVNGTPIFRWELSSTLINRYGTQTLESMIGERLIAEEAKKAGVVVTESDIKEKEDEIVQSFGGNVSLDELLQYQGISKSDFDNQVKLQIMATKLLEKGISVEEGEIDSYITENKKTMIASTEADMKEEAKTILFEQKLNEKIQPWFTDIKSKATILRFLQ